MVFHARGLKEPLVRRADWALGEEPFAKQLQDFMAEPFSDDVAGDRNRRAKSKLIIRHNAILTHTILEQRHTVPPLPPRPSPPSGGSSHR